MSGSKRSRAKVQMHDDDDDDVVVAPPPPKEESKGRARKRQKKEEDDDDKKMEDGSDDDDDVKVSQVGLSSSSSSSKSTRARETGYLDFITTPSYGKLELPGTSNSQFLKPTDVNLPPQVNSNPLILAEYQCLLNAKFLKAFDAIASTEDRLEIFCQPKDLIETRNDPDHSVELAIGKDGGPVAEMAAILLYAAQVSLHVKRQSKINPLCLQLVRVRRGKSKVFRFEQKNAKQCWFFNGSDKPIFPGTTFPSKTFKHFDSGIDHRFQIIEEVSFGIAYPGQPILQFPIPSAVAVRLQSIGSELTVYSPDNDGFVAFVYEQARETSKSNTNFSDLPELLEFLRESPLSSDEKKAHEDSLTVSKALRPSLKMDETPQPPPPQPTPQAPPPSPPKAVKGKRVLIPVSGKTARRETFRWKSLRGEKRGPWESIAMLSGLEIKKSKRMQVKVDVAKLGEVVANGGDEIEWADQADEFVVAVKIPAADLKKAELELKKEDDKFVYIFRSMNGDLRVLGKGLVVDKIVAPWLSHYVTSSPCERFLCGKDPASTSTELILYEGVIEVQQQ
jgi:hypothetical protein